VGRKMGMIESGDGRSDFEQIEIVRPDGVRTGRKGSGALR